MLVQELVETVESFRIFTDKDFKVSMIIHSICQDNYFSLHFVADLELLSCYRDSFSF